MTPPSSRRRWAVVVLLLLLGMVLTAVMVVTRVPSEEPSSADVEPGDATPAHETSPRVRPRRHLSPTASGTGTDANATPPAPTASPPEPSGRDSGAGHEPAAPSPSTDTEDAAELGVLRVQVVDEDRLPRDDAQLQIVGVVNSIGVTLHQGGVDADGRVELRAVEPGRVHVVARSGSLSRTTPIGVVAGETTELEVVLPRGAVVTGVVRHAERGPLEGVKIRTGVIIRGRQEDGVPRDSLNGVTDAEGRYRLTGVPPGTHDLVLQGTHVGWSSRPRSQLVVQGIDDIEHDILVGSVSFEGLVIDAATKQPISGAEVQIQQPYFDMTTADHRGVFRFTDLPPGGSQLCVSAEGYAVRFLDGDEIADGAVSHQVITLTAATKLEIRVRGTDDAPVRGEVIVSFESDDGTNVTTNLRADSEGHIHYDKVLPGEYTIGCRADGWSSASVQTVLEPGENAIVVTLERLPSKSVVVLAGRVVEADTGKPVADARVGSGRSYAVTDAAGNFEFRGGGRPGRVTLSCDGYGLLIVTVPSGGSLTIRAPRAVDLFLRVRRPDGGPYVGRLTISVKTAEDGGTRGGTATDCDERGEARHRRIVPGRYTLRFSATNAGKAELDVDLQPGRNALDIELK